MAGGAESCKTKEEKTVSKRKQAVVLIAMGSDSDLAVMKSAAEALDEFSIPYEMRVLSAHRTPEEVAIVAKSARKAGIRVVIAGAGGAAHLPGMIAAYTELPVIGVPVPLGALQGEDALLSIVQMPKGVPVATVAIGNAYNAGVLAAQILGTGNLEVLDLVSRFKRRMRRTVIDKDKALSQWEST